MSQPTAGALLDAYRQALRDIRDGRATATGLTAAEYARMFLEISPEGVDAAIELERRRGAEICTCAELRAAVEADGVKGLVRSGPCPAHALAAIMKGSET